MREQGHRPPPPHSHSGGLFPAWKRGNFIWREKTPLLGSGGFLPPNHPLSPAPLGAAPQDPAFFLTQHIFGFRACAHCFPCVFSAFSRVRTASPVCFQASGALPKPRAARFRATGALPLLSRRVFSLWECSHGFPRAFPCFGSAPAASPACFQPLGVLPRLSSCISMLRERSQDFRRSTMRCLRSPPACSHRHCPRVARKSYKIFSSGG